MDLAALADFNLVATHAGFGRASRASGRPKASLARRVTELEESLGVRLFERGRMALHLTEEGQALHAQTRIPLNEIAEAAEAIRGGSVMPRGRLRINTPVLFSQVAMGRVAAGFARAYPQVLLEVTAEDRFIDPVEDGYDVVIRVNPRPDDRLVGRCFLKDEWLLVAPVSLDRPALSKPGTGARLPAIVRTQPVEDSVWRVIDRGDEVAYHPEPVLKLSSMIMVREALVAGIGAALLPRFMVADALSDGRVVSWGTYVGHTVEVWVLYTSRRLISSKVTAFVDFLIGSFPDATIVAGSAG